MTRELIEKKAPDWADYYNPVASGTYFGKRNTGFCYQWKGGPVMECGVDTYANWAKNDSTVFLNIIVANE
jgi:hypothetical protein